MTELYYHLHSEDKASGHSSVGFLFSCLHIRLPLPLSAPLLPTTKEDVLKVLLLYPTVDSVQAHVWVEGLATTDPLFAIAPALATTELTAAYWLAQKQGESLTIW